MLRASQGHGDVWLATEESFPIVLRGRVEGRADWFFAGGDLAGALMPTLPRGGRRSEYFPSRDDLFAVAQLGAWAGVRPVPPLAIGVRGQLVVQEGAIESPEYGYGYRTEGTASRSGGVFVVPEYRGPYFFRDDQLEAFVALIPFVRAELDELTLEGRLYLNLDTPDGVAFDQGATWSATLTAGWTP